jgi:outer membrane protein insertion porin family
MPENGPGRRSNKVLDRVRPDRKFLILSGLVLCVLAPRSARAQTPPVSSTSADTVAAVHVEGAHTVDAELVRRGFNVPVGTRYSLDAVRRGIHRLYDLGFFSDVGVEGERVPGGVILTVRVTENPRVGSLEFAGRHKVDEKDLTKALGGVTGKMADDRLLARVERQVRQVYSEKGYTRAQVKARFTPGDSESRRVLLVDVTEGPKVRVEAVRFIGVKRLDGGDLAGAMKQGTKGFLKGGVLKPAVLAEDVKRIEAEMAKRGFRDGKVLSYDVVQTKKADRVRVDVKVEEGPLYTFGNVKWEGNKAISTPVLESATHVVPGQVFNQEKVQKTIEDAYGAYADRGYIYLNVQPDFASRDTIVDVTFQVAEGQPSHIHDILITGNSRTKEKVIRRQLALAPGDLFRRNLLIRSTRELQQLGYFSNIVPDSKPAKDGSNDIDLILNVEERQVGTASAGFGFSSSVGLTGFAELGHTNLFGNGQSLNLRMERGQTGTNAELSFTEPWFRGTPTTFGFDLFNTTRKYQSSNLDLQNATTGGALRLGRPLPIAYTRIFATYRLENQTVTDEAAKTSVTATQRNFLTGFLLNQETQLTSSLSFQLVRNSTNHYLYPTTGSNAKLRTEFSGGPVGGDQTFQKYELDISRYLPSISVGKWRPVLMARGRFGAVGEAFRKRSLIPTGFTKQDELEGAIWKDIPVGYGATIRVPVPYHLQHFEPETNELFRLGGTTYNAFRGYDDFEIVPDDNVTRRFFVTETTVDTLGHKSYSVNPDAIFYPGGKYMSVLTGEFQFPIVDPVHALLLGDMGGTWNDLGDFRWESLHKSLGFGIRVEVPLLGLIGFDYAYGFDRLDRRTGLYNRAGWQPHIQFGRVF